MTIQYRFLLDTEKDWTFTGYVNDITQYVKSAAWGQGMQAPYDTIAAPAYLELTLNNISGDFDQENSSAVYYNRLKKGLLIKVQANYNGSWVTMFVSLIRSIRPSFFDVNKSEIIVSCKDILPEFLAKEFISPLQTNVRVDEALQGLHNGVNAIYPYESYYQFIGYTSIGDGKAPYYGADVTSFETAETTLIYIGDNLDRGNGISVQNFVRDAMAAEVFGMYYFDCRLEKYTFLSRYHSSDESVAWYLTANEFTSITPTDNPYMVNDLSLTYFPRSIGTPESVLWSSDNVPFAVPGMSRPKELSPKFRDPDNPSAQVGALELVPLVPNVDYTANELADGSGFDYTHRLSIFVEQGATGVKMILTNSATGTIYCTLLQIRGTPITSYNSEIVQVVNDESVYNHLRVAKNETVYSIDNEEFANEYATFKTNVLGDPQIDIERVTVMTTKEDNLGIAYQTINRTIGDVINLTDGAYHDKDYMIVAEQHKLSVIDDSLQTTYVLRPTNRGSLFILGTSNSNDGDVLAF